MTVPASIVTRLRGTALVELVGVEASGGGERGWFAGWPSPRRRTIGADWAWAKGANGGLASPAVPQFSSQDQIPNPRMRG